jgi:hypothetical protein
LGIFSATGNATRRAIRFSLELHHAGILPSDSGCARALVAYPDTQRDSLCRNHGCRRFPAQIGSTVSAGMKRINGWRFAAVRSIQENLGVAHSSLLLA